MDARRAGPGLASSRRATTKGSPMPRPRLHVAPLALLLLLAPAAAGCIDPTTADCEVATRHVTDCYGAEIGEAFGATCSAEAAATALAESCPAGEDGKADGFGGAPI